jgi:hypothetical protein
MNRLPDPDTADLVPPGCGPTLDRVQAALDGTASLADLASDPHPAACRTCRERVRAAQLLLATLGEPAEPIAMPPGLTSAILAGVREDRRVRTRRRVLAYVGGGLAAAAAVLLAVWTQWNPSKPAGPQQPEVVKQTPAPTPTPEAPAPRPIRIADEIAKAGDALRDGSRTITEPAAAAPKWFSTLAEPLFNAPANPMADELEPARRSLAELPEAAKVGLEPVTDSAQKAFSRLLRDVGAMQPKTGS